MGYGTVAAVGKQTGKRQRQSTSGQPQITLHVAPPTWGILYLDFEDILKCCS
jgi:hypothetical protein